MTTPKPQTRMVLLKHEIFGAPECVLLHRWTLLKLWPGSDGPKIMLHWFVPDGEETDYHDHPRNFLTIVLRGSYVDLRVDGHPDFVRAPTIRYRRATHAHRTIAGHRGCLTLAIFGNRKREWGFFRKGTWYQWRTYERIFGDRFRCP